MRAPTKLEQVARAIEGEVDKLADVRNIPGFYGQIARAAVEALREPTAAMCDAAIPKLLYDDQRDCIADAYQAMIDAILNEKPE